MKNYLIHLLITLVFMYSVFLMLVLLNIVAIGKATDIGFHFGVFAIACLGSMFNDFLKSKANT